MSFQWIDERAIARMKSELIKKPLHPERCSIPMRFSICNLAFSLTGHLGRSDFANGMFAGSAGRLFFRQHSFIMRQRFAVFLIEGAKSIHYVVPTDDVSRSVYSQIGSCFYRAGVRRP